MNDPFRIRRPAPLTLVLVLAAAAILAAMAALVWRSRPQPPVPLPGNPRPAAPVTAELTPEERAYLDRLGPVRLCVDPDWEPYETISEQGTHEGIAADLLRLIAERTGITFELVPTADWEESLEFSRTGRTQVLAFLNQTPQRDEWLLFTEPYFTDPNVFITRQEYAYIRDPANLDGATIALPAGTMIEERVRRDYPNLRVIPTETEAQALAMVDRRQADMTLRSLTMAAYTVRKEGLFNLKVAGQPSGYTNQLRIGVTNREPMLRDILDKGVATLSPREVQDAVNRHVYIMVQTPVDYALVGKVALGFSLILALGGLWAWQLRRLNRQLAGRQRELETLGTALAHQASHDPLTNLLNRRAILERLNQEFSRSERRLNDLAVGLCDIDHFKQINDTRGHQVGDDVLRALAGVLEDNVRDFDTVGRVGGEEFLILAPLREGTTSQGLFERLRQRVAETPLPTRAGDLSITVSIGVACTSRFPGEDAVLEAADLALYQAKNSGRNRVALVEEPVPGAAKCASQKSRDAAGTRPCGGASD